LSLRLQSRVLCAILVPQARPRARISSAVVVSRLRAGRCPPARREFRQFAHLHAASQALRSGAMAVAAPRLRGFQPAGRVRQQTPGHRQERTAEKEQSPQQRFRRSVQWHRPAHPGIFWQPAEKTDSAGWL